MDTIRTYLDNVFSAFPDTEKVRSMKREMLLGMEEKYLALKLEGKSEHEAVGNVIADFGSIDEIASVLNFAPHPAQNVAQPAGYNAAQSAGYAAYNAPQSAGYTTYNTPQPTEPLEKSIHISNSEAYAYVTLSKKCARWIGLGVWLILTGVALMLLLRPQTATAAGNVDIGPLGIMALMTSIALAVAMFITSGIRMSKYESYQKTKIRLDAQTRLELEDKNARFLPRFAALIAAAVALILISVGVMVALPQLSEKGEGLMPVSILLFSIGFAVFLLINGGMLKSSYDILLGKGEYERKIEYNKANGLMGAVASGLFPLTALAFLLWGFIGEAWHIAWILFPVAGILFGAFAGAISTWSNTKRS